MARAKKSNSSRGSVIKITDDNDSLAQAVAAKRAQIERRNLGEKARRVIERKFSHVDRLTLDTKRVDSQLFVERLEEELGKMKAHGRLSQKQLDILASEFGYDFKPSCGLRVKDKRQAVDSELTDALDLAVHKRQHDTHDPAPAKVLRALQDSQSAGPHAQSCVLLC